MKNKGLVLFLSFVIARLLLELYVTISYVPWGTAPITVMDIINIVFFFFHGIVFGTGTIYVVDQDNSLWFVIVKIALLVLLLIPAMVVNRSNGRLLFIGLIILFIECIKIAFFLFVFMIFAGMPPRELWLNL